MHVPQTDLLRKRLRHFLSRERRQRIGSKIKPIRCEKTLNRIKSLVIPPAWKDVWICAQPQGHLQTLVRLLKHGQQPQAACDAPRWKVATGLSVDLEPTMAPQLVADLKAMGHQVEATPDAYMDYGSGQFIWKLSGDLVDGYVAASDSRRDGQAVGY